MTAKKTDELFALYKQFAESQRRQQVVVVVILSALTALATGLCTWITWESVSVRREANELQRQLIELQTASPPPKAALTPRSDAHRAVQASAGAHRAQSRTHSSEQESTGSRQSAINGKARPAAENNSPPSPRNWSVRSAMLDRPGRQ
jgi:hypothetical protein